MIQTKILECLSSKTSLKCFFWGDWGHESTHSQCVSDLAGTRCCDNNRDNMFSTSKERKKKAWKVSFFNVLCLLMCLRFTPARNSLHIRQRKAPLCLRIQLTTECRLWPLTWTGNKVLDKYSWFVPAACFPIWDVLVQLGEIVVREANY